MFVTPSAMHAMPANTTHQVSSSQTASMICPFLIFSTKLMAMPVTIWTKPSAMAPIRIVIVSSSGVKSAGSALNVVSGLMMPTSCGRKSPKKPPVSAPMMNVLMPQENMSPNICPLVPFGRDFFVMMIDARIIKSPYPMSAIMMP